MGNVMTEQNHNRGQILPEAVKAEREELDQDDWLNELLWRAGIGLVVIFALGAIYNAIFW